MESHTQDQNIFLLKQLITSTLPTKSSTNSQEIRENRTRINSPLDEMTGFRFLDMNEDLICFIRCYFAGCKVNSEVINSVLEYLQQSDDTFRTDFVNSILCHVFLDKYPIRKSYRRTILKTFIEKMEGWNLSMENDLYSALAETMIETEKSSYRIYLNFDGSKIFTIIQESNQQLSHGTTGLSLWQASCDLSNLLCHLNLTYLSPHSDKVSILELGSGCGLAGIVAHRNFSPNVSIYLSDYDEKVLEQLQINAELNGMMNSEKNVDGRSRNNILNIDWTKFDITDEATLIPDVIIAADVVYDRSMLSPLCNVLKQCLNKKTTNVIIASTLRDPETLQAFRNKIADAGLEVYDEARYQYGCLTSPDGQKRKITSMFPHSSTLDSPTIFFCICLAR